MTSNGNSPNPPFVLIWAIAAGFLVALVGCGSPRQVVTIPVRTEVLQETAVPFALDEMLGTDPSVRIGRLENGITFYIRRNERPLDRAELRLVVNAGSVLEDDDQLGLAHFVEHMAFNGTRRFERQALVDYLESIGTRFGPDLNAYTGFDETVFLLEVRTDSAAQLATGLEILREWGDQIAFEGEEIEKERGVVLEEWRQGLGASSRIRDTHFPVLLQGSRYARRLPIGDPELLATFDHEALIRFYRDWYRPDLMAVVAVGDFDPDSVEVGIVSRFGDMPGRDAPRARAVFPVPSHAEPLVSIATDPELPYGSVEIIFKRPRQDGGSLLDFRHRLVSSLYNGMFNARLSELTQDADPPLTAAFSGSQRFARSVEFHSLQAIVREDQYARALETLLAEAERVRRFGFGEGELARRKAELLRSYELAYAERDKTESARYASQYVRHFLEGDPVPGIDRMLDVVRQLLPTIGLDEVNERAVRTVQAENRVLLVSAPERDKDHLPSDEELLAKIAAADSLDVTPYVDRTLDAPLLPGSPPAGRILEETHLPEIDVTLLRLSNGARVVFKPTDFKNDEVLFSATSPGGTSLVPDSLFLAASMAAGIVGQSGVGNFGPIELDKKLSGKVVGVSPSISGLSEGLGGRASPADLETLFQLIYLYGTAPRADSVAFESYRKRLAGILSTSKADPASAFSDTIQVTMARYHPRARPLTEDMLAEMDLQASYRIFRDRFADFGDFVFYFVGNFEADRMKSLSAQYLAPLPSDGRQETWIDLGIRPPDGRVSKTVRRGIEQKSSVQIVYTGKAPWSMDERRLLSVLSQAFQIRLREVLREDLGGTYGVSVGASISPEPYPSYQFSISFGCDPQRVDELKTQVYAQVDSLIAFGLEQTYLTKAREGMLRTQETSLRDNRYWLSTIALYDRYGLDLQDIPNSLRRMLERLTPAHLKSTAQHYLATPNVAEFVLLPEH